jgi:hypothetical protein
MNTLKLALPLVKLALPKLIRQGLAALGGALAAQGILHNGEASNFPLLIAGFLLWGLTSAYSAYFKTEPNEEAVNTLKKVIAATVSQGFSFFAGWLSQAGFQGNPADTEAVALFFANLGLSAVSRPDAPKKK